MLCLVIQILFKFQAMRRADRENPVTGLPMKVFVLFALGLDPLRCPCLYLFDEFGWRTCSRMGRQQMNMILDRAGMKQRSFQIVDDASGVGMQFIPYVVRNDSITMFGGEHNVDKKPGKRLRHVFHPFIDDTSTDRTRNAIPGQRPTR